MKTPKFLNQSSFIALSIAIFFSVTSCEKDDKADEPAKYVGVWVTEKTVPVEGGSITVKDVISFSKNSFTEVAKIQDSNTDLWIDIIGRKGTFTAEDDEMDVSITEAGATSTDPETGEPTGNIVYYKDGTTEFSDLLVEMEMSGKYIAKYSITGNALTLKADNNNNGSYEDEDEVNIFTRQ